jgi:integrase
MPRRGRRHRLAKGIFRDESGLAVIFKAAGTPQEERRFPADSDVKKLAEWRETEIKKRKKRAAAGLAPAGTFAADAATYLAAVAALPSHEKRRREIGVWVALFGERRRDTIQPHEIRAARDRWLTVGPKMVMRPGGYVEVAAPQSPSSVNKRLRALENLWTVLDGKKADNPVREVPEADEGDPAPRGLSYRVIERLFKAMPPAHPMTIRLRIMAYAGLAQSELARVTEDQIDLRNRQVWVPGRKKGHGAKGGAVPLSPAAWAAFRDLVKLEAVGPFNTSSMWHFFTRYAREAGYEGLTPYQLRHSFFTGVQAASKDERALAAISRHGSRKTLRRYTEAAAHPAAVAAVAAFRDGKPQRRVPETVPAFAVGGGRKPSPSVGARRGIS